MARNSSKKPDKLDSKNCAVLAARSPVLMAQAIDAYSGLHGRMEIADLVDELKGLGKEIADGDMTRIEKMLANQAILLDTLFANMMCRANQCETMKGMETYMRLGLKAQAQARATAESLSVIKNPPVVYAKQANIAAGHQQINSYVCMPAHGDARTEEDESAPNKLLEVSDGERLEFGEEAAAGRSHQDMATMGAVNRAGD